MLSGATSNMKGLRGRKCWESGGRDFEFAELQCASNLRVETLGLIAAMPDAADTQGHKRERDEQQTGSPPTAQRPRTAGGSNAAKSSDEQFAVNRLGLQHGDKNDFQEVLSGVIRNGPEFGDTHSSLLVDVPAASTVRLTHGSVLLPLLMKFLSFGRLFCTSGLRAGPEAALVPLFNCIIALCSLIGGGGRISKDSLAPAEPAARAEVPSSSLHAAGSDGTPASAAVEWHAQLEAETGAGSPTEQDGGGGGGGGGGGAQAQAYNNVATPSPQKEKLSGQSDSLHGHQHCHQRPAKVH